MSHKPISDPPASLAVRNPEGYARALDRAVERRERRTEFTYRSERARLNGFASIAKHRRAGFVERYTPARATQDSAGLWAGLRRPVLHWRPLDLTTRGYVWTGKSWRYPQRERVTR